MDRKIREGTTSGRSGTSARGVEAMGAVSQARRSPSRLPGRKPGSLVPASAERASLSPSLQRQGRASRSEPNRTKRTKRANRRGYKSVVRSLTAGGHRSASIQGQPLRRLFRDLFLPASPIFLSPPPALSCPLHPPAGRRVGSLSLPPAVPLSRFLHLFAVSPSLPSFLLLSKKRSRRWLPQGRLY